METSTKKERQEWEIKEAKELTDKLKNVAFFPGNVQEYEKFSGHAMEIIDTKRPDKGVLKSELNVFAHYGFFNYGAGFASTPESFTFARYLADIGIEALVNTKFHTSGIEVTDGELYGLPVKRK